jgi:hypothetical protein
MDASRASSVRRGAVLVNVAVAMVALLAMTALAIDVTRLHIAAQRAQNVADAAAYAGGSQLPKEAESRDLALKVAASNNAELPMWTAVVEDPDVTYYPPGSTIYRPDGTVLITLGPGSTGLKVVAHCTIDYSLARMFGFLTGTANRYAVVIRGAASGMPCVPIWISAGSPELVPEGDPVNLNKNDTVYDYNHDGVPDTLASGSFGFLDFSAQGCDQWFQELLHGFNVEPQVQEASFVRMGETVTAYTGEHVGQWNQALTQETGQDAGTARLERAQLDPVWSQESYTTHSYNHPRIMLVPIVEYQGSNGNNATYTIVGFASMWLENVTTVNGEKVIQVRFLEFQYDTGGGGDLDPDAGGRGGVFIVRPIA